MFAEPPGIPLDAKRERTVENYFHREDFRRALSDDIGTVIYPPRAIESYLLTLSELWDTAAIKARTIRVAIDYGASAAGLLLPHLLDELDLELLTTNIHGESGKASLSDKERIERSVEKVARLITSMEADAGVVFDAPAERLVILDERGDRISDNALLLLLLEHACRQEGSGTVAFPLNVTRHVDAIANRYGMDVVRTKVSPSFLLAEAANKDVVFAGTADSGFAFPRFLASLDAVFAFGKVLELVASDERSLSAQVADLPKVYTHHLTVPCPWYAKGSVMRLMVEELKDANVSLVDGIKVTLANDDWVQIIPDADEPLFHVFAESDSDTAVAVIAEEYEQRLRLIIDERQAT
jgi:mannose-1-phosphate guanylyltransferase/phosphomannomutase